MKAAIEVMRKAKDSCCCHLGRHSAIEARARLDRGLELPLITSPCHYAEVIEVAIIKFSCLKLSVIQLAIYYIQTLCDLSPQDMLGKIFEPLLQCNMGLVWIRSTNTLSPS